VVTAASRWRSSDTALRLLHRRRAERQTRRRWTVGGDKGYGTKDFVAGCRALAVTPHVTQHTPGDAGRSTSGPRAMPAMR
jgi:hypothetical protein